jgi:hypothetical protein
VSHSQERCEPAFEPPEDVDDACAPPLSCWALESPVSLATLTGAFAFTGAFTAVDGEALIEPTCTVPIECFAVCEPESEQPQDVDDADTPPLSSWAPGSPVSLATLTGAFAFTGAFTVVDGEALMEPTWTVPTDPTAVWLPEPGPSLAAALPASASASRLTPNAQRRFIVFSSFALRSAWTSDRQGRLARALQRVEERRRSTKLG